MARARRIRTQPSRVYSRGSGYRHLLRGWLEGKDTFLTMALITPRDGTFTLARYQGRKLYRLAKAIVRQFEKAHDD